MTSIYSFSATSISGEPVAFERYRGRVMLIVNVASQCGFTPQYQGLQALHRQFHDQGLDVLGFPCNQFGHQEPGDSSEIQSFCSTTYDVGFALFEKIQVNGPQAHPLYKWLKQQKSGVLGTRQIKWNFTKFLLGTGGQVIQRYGSSTKPDELRPAIEQALKGSS